jgi:hypothetical protein
MGATHDIEYFLQRESEELTASLQAMSERAKQIHFVLSELYGQKALSLVGLSNVVCLDSAKRQTSGSAADAPEKNRLAQPARDCALASGKSARLMHFSMSK